MPSPIPNAPRSDRTPPGVHASRPAAALDPLDLLVALGRSRWMLVVWPLVAGVIAAIVSLLLPPTFTGVTRILPPQQAQSSAASMLSQLGGLAGLAGAPLGIKNPSDLYVAMLKSTTVADALVERFDLKNVYRERLPGVDLQLLAVDVLQVDARKALAERSRFVAEKSGVIVIEVDARDRGLAADLANAYVEQLHELTSTLAVSEAAQRRVFFERHLQEAKEKLAEAELALRHGIESGGLVSVDAQSRATVETVARLRAQISAREIQLRALRAYATPSNPDVRRAEQELSSMRQELSRLESGSGGAGAAAADGRAADRGLDTIRLVREVKYGEVMFELMAKQYELARVDESKEAPLVQVMDRAAPPEKRTRPKRTRMVLLSAAGAFLAAVLFAFVRDALEDVRSDPLRREKLAALRSAWRPRQRP